MCSGWVGFGFLQVEGVELEPWEARRGSNKGSIDPTMVPKNTKSAFPLGLHHHPVNRLKTLASRYSYELHREGAGAAPLSSDIPRALESWVPDTRVLLVVLCCWEFNGF